MIIVNFTVENNPSTRIQIYLTFVMLWRHERFVVAMLRRRDFENGMKKSQK